MYKINPFSKLKFAAKEISLPKMFRNKKISVEIKIYSAHLWVSL